MGFVVVQIDEATDLGPFTYEEAALRAAGGELRAYDVTEAEDVPRVAADADVVWLGWDPALTKDLLAQLPRCRLAIRWGVGHEQIDSAGATELGIAVANAPTYGSEDVAEHAIALLMASAKRVVWAHEQIRAGGWPSAVAGTVHRIKGQTLGIIGVGRIGSATARRGLGLGMRVIGYDNARPDHELRAMGVEPVDLATLAAQADHVSVHVPYSASSHHLVDAALIEAFKPGVILVNTSRGKVLDQGAVIAALHSGKLRAAALDVFDPEPPAVDDPVRSAPNIILTPHHASWSDEAMEGLREEMCRTTIDFMRTGWADPIVNPQVRDRLKPPNP